MNKRKKYYKIGTFIINIFFLWMILFTIFISFSYGSRFIINDRLKHNAIRSLTILEEEGEFPKYPIGWYFYQKDNHTDAIMLTESYSSIDSLSNFKNMLLNPTYVRIHKIHPATIALNQTSENQIEPYGRYWHGYLVPLRLLLNFTDISYIRWINAIILWSLSLLNCILLYRRFNKFISFSYLGSLLVVGIPTIPFSMQFFTCFFIMNLALLYFIILKPKYFVIKHISLIFFIIGAVTSFFDLLTTPLITFGVPILVVLLRRKNLPDLKLYFISGFMWGFGYIGLWVTKWIFTQKITSFQMIDNAVGSVAYHSSNALGNTLAIQYSLNYIVYFLILSSICYVAICILFYNKDFVVNFKKNFIFALNAWIPCIWILLFQTHSILHIWFVWREFIIFFFSLSILIYLSLPQKNVGYCNSHSMLQ